MATERGALGYVDRVDGIDVSQVQRGIAYDRVAAAGFKFAVVKASEGLGYTDPEALRHLAGFRGVGMVAFCYAFLRPSQGDPRGQVRRLWDSMGDEYGRMVLDLETRIDTLSSQKIVDFAVAAAEAVLELGALRAVVYTYPDYSKGLQPELGRSRLGELTHLWMADYGRREPFVPAPGAVPYAPLPWGPAAIWQYGGNGGHRVPGVPGACDRNLFLGDDAAFRAWRGLPPEPPTLPATEVA